MEIHFLFQDKVTYKKTRTSTVAEATAVTSVVRLTLPLLYYIALSYIIVAEPEPADLQWSGQKTGLDYNLLMCCGISSLAILYMESGDT